MPELSEVYFLLENFMFNRHDLYGCKRLWAGLIGGLCLAYVTLGLAHAQSWPTKIVTIVVPCAPGGGTDIGTRILAQKLSQLWGQSVVIDNKLSAD